MKAHSANCNPGGSGIDLKGLEIFMTTLVLFVFSPFFLFHWGAKTTCQNRRKRGFYCASGGIFNCSLKTGPTVSDSHVSC